MKKHFDYSGYNRKYSYTKGHYAPKYITQNHQFDFLETKTDSSVKMFIVYIIYTQKDLTSLKEEFDSEEFRGFSFFIKNYKSRVISDIDKFINGVTFDELYESFFLKKVDVISFYFISKFKFKDESNRKIKDSNIYFDLFYRSKKLIELLNVDEEFMLEQVNRIK